MTSSPTGADSTRPASAARIGFRWSLLGAVLTLAEAIVLLGLAALYLLELSRGDGDVTTVILSGALIVVTALLLILLARLWLARSRRATTPTLVWNAILIPVVITLYSSGEALVATGVLALAAASIVTAVGAAAGAREG